MIEIIDISHHQGVVDFDAVADSGILAVGVKATEGQTYTDPRFRESWAELVRLGSRMKRFAYHFARVDTDGGDPADARAEANNFCDVLDSVGDYGRGALPPALDVEWGGSEPGHEKNQDWIRAWVEVVTERMGRSPMHYNGENYWRDRVGNSAEWIHLPLWRVDIDDADPSPAPWPAYTLHQYTFEGSVPGVTGNVDRNRLHEIADLELLAEPTIWTPANPWVPGADPGITKPDGSILPVLDIEAMPSGQSSGEVATAQWNLAGYSDFYGVSAADPGVVDGKPGANTLAAVRGFQLAAGLGVTGVVDGATWWALLAGQP